MGGIVHSIPARVAKYADIKSHHAHETETTTTTDDLDSLGQLGDARRCPEGGPPDAHQAAEKQPATLLKRRPTKLNFTYYYSYYHSFIKIHSEF